MKEPIRWIQTNLRQTDADLDSQNLISQVTDFDAHPLVDWTWLEKDVR